MSEQPVVQTKSAEQTIREALQTIANLIVDASGLEIVTEVQPINPLNLSAPLPPPAVVAKTIIKIDGDRTITVPVTVDTGDIVISQAIYDLHQQNVQEAAAYRKQILDTLVEFIRGKRA